MNSTINDLMNRRSIRKFKPEQINREELDMVLQAGICAPSGKNLQSAIIVAVQNPNDIAYMNKYNSMINGVGNNAFYGAPTVLVVLAEAGSRFAVQDGSLVLGNLMNAAHAIGLGSCWINRAYEFFNMDEGKALLKKWGIEGEYIGIGNCILGYPDSQPEMKPRKENYVYYVD